MNKPSSIVIFEYPLNEKMRTWLRIEYLLQHLSGHTTLAGAPQLLFFLHHLSTLLDILDRNDSRSDLLKDLERQQQKLSQWVGTPGVDMSRLETLRQRLRDCAEELLALPRLHQLLREDRLLSAVRHRLTAHGNGYPFDLPILHLWLHQAPEAHRKQITHWLAAIQPLQSALKLHLSLLRQLMPFRQQQAIQGFYKDKTEESDLLRLQLARQQSLFPQISAHQSRFVIRFLSYEQAAEKIPDQLFFGLACC